MAKYKNISKDELTVPNVGVVKSGEIVETPEDFHNINFERVEKKKEDNKSQA
jgi:hypothetical protein